MRILLLYIFITLVQLNHGSYQDILTNDNTPVGSDVDLPPVLRKYHFESPDVVYHPRELPVDNGEEEDIDYENAKEIENIFDYKRGYPGALLSNNDDQSTVLVSNEDICDSAVCREVAENIKKNLDTNHDPCEDFDQFACGGWRERYPIPKTVSESSVFMKLWRDEEEMLKKLIEEQVNSSVNSTGELLYSWYSSCMNESEIARLGATPLLQLIHQLHSCPLLNYFWSPTTWSFIDHLVVLNRIGIYPFIQLSPAADKYNSSKILLHLFPSKLPLTSPTMYLKSGKYFKSVRHSYLKLMIKLMSKLSPAVLNREYFEYNIKRIFAMDFMLAKTRVFKHNKGSYKKMSLNRLQREIPEFPWKIYLLKLYTNIPQNKSITGDEMIAVYNINVLKRICQLLTRTTKSEAANYLIWNIVHKFSSDLSPDFEEIYNEFYCTMYGKKERNPRWRECVASTSSALSMVLGKLFVKAKFNKESREKAAEIIEHIRQQLMKSFTEIPWMDSKTAKKAEEKANAIVKNIGYPDFILNETLLHYYYKGLKFHPRQFLGNIIHRRFVITRNTLASRELKPDRKCWSMSPQEVNAYYSVIYNKIVFPAGVLQAPYWHSTLPMSLQYAGLGFIAGHEITHGFDATGMHYDKYGNYLDWWTNSSLNLFLSKIQCLKHQYSNYTIFGKNINGNTTVSENIADNAGIRLAYTAFKDWVKENGADKTLPGLPFNSDQLFFVKGAQVWCANVRKQSILHKIATDEHTPKMFRTIGIMSNLAEFSKAFNCPVGSKMNPEKKCRVW